MLSSHVIVILQHKINAINVSSKLCEFYFLQNYGSQINVAPGQALPICGIDNSTSSVIHELHNLLLISEKNYRYL